MDLLAQLDRFLSERLSPAVKRIFLINVGVFLLLALLGGTAPHLRNSLVDLFAENPRRSIPRLFVWQFLTYMFIHVDGLHILFNMMILWFFGPELEYRWGRRGFWQFYLVTGIGAGLLHAAIALVTGRELGPIIGASGALFGILLAYAAYFPGRMVYFYGIFPIQMKYLVFFIVLVEFFTVRGGSGDGISHMTHLAGLVVAFFYLSRYHRTSDITKWRYLR